MTGAGRPARGRGFSRTRPYYRPQQTTKPSAGTAIPHPADGHGRPAGWNLLRDRDVTHVKQPKPSPRSRKLQANRQVTVFVSLVATVAATSLLLMLLKTPQLTSTTWRTMFAVGAPETLDAIFQTQAAVTPGRWRYIYVHHSGTVGGDAVSLCQRSADGLTAGFGDHFVIGNGDGCVDGEVQMTQAWNHQDGIRTPPPGARPMSSGCISICVVGDFSRTVPTAAQQRRLVQLVDALQARLHIPAQAVFVHSKVDAPAGAGHAFPEADFRRQLLP